MAIGLGVDVAKKVGLVGSLDDLIPPDYEQIMITGNAALSLGQLRQDWTVTTAKFNITCYNNFDLDGTEFD